LSITSRDHTGNTTDEFSSTAPAALQTIGSQIVVGGDVLVQSGDALVAETGVAAFGTGIPATALINAPPYALIDFPAGLIVVGGTSNVPLTSPLTTTSLLSFLIPHSKCTKGVHCVVLSLSLSLSSHQAPSPSSQVLSRASATMATAATMPVQHSLTWLRLTPTSTAPSRASPYREALAARGMCVLLQQLPVVSLSHHTLGWRIGGTHEAR
jgi:hypothetical protein